MGHGGEPVDIYDPDWYVDGDFHGDVRRAAATDPVYWQDMPDEPGYWAVLRHTDVVHVARNPEALLGVARRRGARGPRPRSTLEMMRHMMLAMDPPHHMNYRRPLAPHFTART